MSDTPATPEDVLAKPASQLVPEPSKGVTSEEWLKARRTQREAREAVAEKAAEAQEEVNTEEEPAPDGQSDAVETETAPGDEDNQDVDLRPGEETEAQDAEDSSEQQQEDSEDNTEDEVFPETVTALAEHLGFDPADLSEHLKVMVKLDGRSKEVTLAEAAQGYQRLEDYRAKTAAVAEEERNRKAAFTEAQERQNAMIQQLDAAAMHLAREIDMGPSDAELTALRDSDPVRYRNLKDVQTEKKAALQQALVARQEHNRQVSEEAQAKAVETRKEQQAKLAEMVPDLTKPEKQATVEAKIKSVMTDPRVGFTSEEVDAYFNGAFDARAIHAFHLLGQFFDQQKANKETRKVLKKKPKPAKPGARQARTQAQSDADQVRSAKAKLRQSGTKEDALALLKARRLARRNAANGGSKPQNYV